MSRPDRAFYEAIIDSSPLVVVRLTGDGTKVRYISPNCTRLFGWSPDTVLETGWSWMDLVHREDVAGTTASFAEFLADPTKPMTAYFRISTTEGASRWTVTRFRQDPSDQGDLLGFLLDIHDRVVADAALRTAKDEAERANRATSEHLSRVSHELRAPLRSILDSAHLLERGEVEAGRAEAVAQILQEGHRLLELVDELLPTDSEPPGVNRGSAR